MQIKTEETRKEIKEHGVYSYPVNVSIEHIQAYEQGMFLWHWHPEIELTLVLSGTMQYRVNDKIYTIVKGDGIFGNSNTLHSGMQIEDQECSYLTITFHPRFLYGYSGSILHTKYVSPILSNPECGSLKLDPSSPLQDDILQKMQEIYKLSEENSLDVEMKVHILLSQIWQDLYQLFESTPKGKNTANKNTLRIQEIISYLQAHYKEEISLDDISSHINLCKNECCRFFKKYMDLTIVEYLTILRIQNSLLLLKQGESVTDVANAVGFASPAYFGQMFKRHMGMTPKEYQKSQG